MFYKVKNEIQIIDVLKDLNYIKYDERAKMILRCKKKDNPDGFLDRNSSNIYVTEPNEKLGKDAILVTLEECYDEELYIQLLKALEETQTIVTEEEIEPNDILGLVQLGKVAEMSRLCEETIMKGFDVEDENGVHHYSLEVTDQMMISMLAIKASNGEVNLPWHADNEACRIYTKEEILSLNAKMERLIMYNQTYFNSLKMYIMALDDCKAIREIEYGVDIPEEYQSEVLKGLLAC